VQSIQKDSKSTVGQIKLIKQMQSQLKQLQNQLTQIQKFITKKDSATKTTQLRKKTINANRSRKKR
jgi:glutamate 5-kinase